MVAPRPTPRGTALAMSSASSSAAILLLTFDCTGTLFEPTESAGALYKQALVGEATRLKLGVEAAQAVQESILDAAFARAYKAQTIVAPCFGADLCSSQQWWERVVEQTFTETVPSDLLSQLLPGTFEKLYSHVFIGERGWRVRAGVGKMLTECSRWKRAAADAGAPTPVVGVISNWDERLSTLLQELHLYGHFDFVLTSREAGVEKPDGRIFEAARDMAHTPHGARAVHVGDSFFTDVEGAFGAGFEAVFVAPRSTLETLKEEEPKRLARSPHMHCEDIFTLNEQLGLDPQLDSFYRTNIVQC